MYIERKHSHRHTCTLAISSLSVEHTLQFSILVVLHMFNSECQPEKMALLIILTHNLYVLHLVH